MRLIDIEISEAFTSKRAEKGQVPFKKSTLSDAHIQKVITKISNETGVPVADIQKELQQDIDKLKEIGQYSPLLYDTLMQNSAEQAAFTHIEKSVNLKKMNFSDVNFDVGTFRKLIRLVSYENSAFFPLTAPGDFRRIYSITPILVPTSKPELKQFNQVTTAAATANGDFIFNVEFMQRLINYASAIDLKPKGRKYQSNGGTIPDNYAYIEFLIIHELLHYAYGDFAAGRKFKQYSGLAHNWASDFRSNYLLVKSGYEQLPIGLYSDDLNFDRKETDSYEKLIRIVDQEMKKLPQRLQAWVEEEFETDVHDDSQDSGEEQGGQEQEEWMPQVGEIVLHNKEGSFGRITKINDDGTVETTPVSKEEVEREYPGVKVG